MFYEFQVLNTNFCQLCPGAVFVSTTQFCKIKPEPRFFALPVFTNFWYGLKGFNLFMKETLKKFGIRERCKSRQKFGGAKACKAEEVRKYFINPKIEIEFFSFIICSFDFKSILCTLSFCCIWERWMLSFRGTYWLSITYFILLPVFCFFLLFSFFLRFFVSSISCWGIEVSLEILKIKQWSCS